MHDEAKRADVFKVAFRNYWWASCLGGLYFVAGFVAWGGTRAAIASSTVFFAAALTGLIVHYLSPFRSRRQGLMIVVTSLIIGQAVLAWQKANLPLSDYTGSGDPAARDTLTYLVSAIFIGTMSMFGGRWGAGLALASHYLFIFDFADEFSFTWVFPILIAAAGLIFSTAFWKLDEAYDHLETLADRDPLTGLLNRHRLVAEFERLRRHAGVRRKRLLLVAWDLDDLKRINDKEGHAAGDGYIRDFAGALSSTVRAESAARAGDAAFRVGGDEFISLHLDAEDGTSIVARVRAQCASVSAGWVQAEALSLDQAMSRADQAMYLDKQARKRPLAP